MNRDSATRDVLIAVCAIAFLIWVWAMASVGQS